MTRRSLYAPQEATQTPADGSSPVATAPTPRTAPQRAEARAWLDLALALRVVAADCAAAPGIDYARMADRVQTSRLEVDVPHGYGRGHVRPDRVAARLATITGRPHTTLAWLRSFGPAVDCLRADVVADRLRDLLDAAALAVATVEDRQRWAVADKPREAQRSFARRVLREAWAAWYGEAW